MEPTQQQELERFFAEVAPRLDTAQTLDDELDRQLARRFNVFRYLRTDEMGFSKMIADLLDPAGDHGQGAAFLKLLTDKLDFAKGVNLDHARMQTERQIDVGRLDIAIEINGTHCLAIENKSNNAGDQEGQVEHYLRWLKCQYRHSLLIYLSPTGDGPSEVSVAAGTIRQLRTAAPRRLVIMPCYSSGASDDEFDELRLPFSLVDWLADCRRHCDVDRLRWYLRETETYCRQRYGGNVVTDSKKSAIADFVRGDDNRNVVTAFGVYKAWPVVAREIKKEFLDLIWHRLPEDMLRCRNYGEKRYESYVYIYREYWRPYVVDGQERFTAIYMQAESSNCTNWDIGVSSPAATNVSGNDRERSERLHNEIGKLSKSLGKNQNVYWPWWEWIDDKYRDWNLLIPKMHEELQQDGDGEITNYFIGKFKEIADKAIPIIDRIDGR